MNIKAFFAVVLVVGLFGQIALAQASPAVVYNGFVKINRAIPSVGTSVEVYNGNGIYVENDSDGTDIQGGYLITISSDTPANLTFMVNSTNTTIPRPKIIPVGGPFTVIQVNLSLDTLPPVFYSINTSDVDTIYTNGETVNITVNLAETELNVSADFSSVDSNYAPGSESVVNNSDGTYNISYTISLSNAKQNGTYAILMTAIDNLPIDGADHVVPNNSFTITLLDTTEPNSSISTAGNLNSTTYANINGTASDLGSGIASVSISINRSADGKFWDGSAWVLGQAWLSANGTVNWNYSFAPEDGQTYLVSSRATDIAGNVEASYGTATFTYATSITASVPFTSLKFAPYNLSSVNISETSLSNGDAAVNGTVLITVPLTYGSTAENVTLNLTLLNGSTRRVYGTSEGIIVSPQTATLTNISVSAYSTSSETNRTISLNLTGTGVQEVVIYTGSFGKPSYLRFENNSNWIVVNEGVGLWSFSYDPNAKIAVALVQFGSPHVLETIWRTIFSPSPTVFYYSGGGSAGGGVYSFSITAPSSIEFVAGDSKSVGIELENTGSLNLGEVSWALEGAAKGWASISPADLPAGAKVSLSLTISVPAGTAEGAYSLALKGSARNAGASKSITVLVSAPVIEAAIVTPPVEEAPVLPPAEVAPAQPAPEAPAEAPAPEVAIPVGPTGFALAAQRLTASPVSLLVVIVIAVLAVAAYLRPRLK